MSKIQVFRYDWIPTQVEVDQDDLISISEAARLRGVSIPAISNAMSMGDLPVFQFLTEMPNARIQRFTSRRAVEALPKAKRGSVMGSGDPSYRPTDVNSRYHQSSRPASRTANRLANSAALTMRRYPRINPNQLGLFVAHLAQATPQAAP
jgi:hypothetical protein